jgi:hypothetical protein
MAIVVFLSLLCAGAALSAWPAAAFQPHEHAFVADESFRRMIEEADLPFDHTAPLWDGRSFGDVSAWSARDDQKNERHHVRGHSVLE